MLGQRQKTATTQATPTEQQSLSLMKNLLRVTVCTISYLRNFFDEDFFDDRQLEGINLKVLRRDRKDESVEILLNWVEKGCFDALEKGYLRQMEIVVYTDPEHPEIVCERYRFCFGYGKDRHQSVDMYHNEKKFAQANTKDEIRRATVRMFRTLLLLSENLDTLPEKSYVTVRMRYYDDVTPEDYQPPGFSDASDLPSVQFQGDAMSLRVGGIDTPFHGMEMHIKSDRIRFGDEQMPGDANDNNAVEGAELNDQKGNSDQVAQEPDENPCPCNTMLDKTPIVKCTSCGGQHHAACIGYIGDCELPSDYKCHGCGGQEQGQARAMFRLALQFLYEQSTQYISQKTLADVFGLDSTLAKALVGRLQKEGFLVGDRKKGNRIQRNRFTSSGLTKFFTSISLPLEDEADDLTRSAQAMTIREDKTSPVIGARGKRQREEIGQQYDVLPDSQEDGPDTKRAKQSSTAAIKVLRR